MARPRKHLPGDTFGMLTLIDRDAVRGRFECQCGGTRDAVIDAVARGRVTTCGNLQAHPRAPRKPASGPRGRRVKHGPGARFGALVLIERLGTVRGSQRVGVQCDCGGERALSLQNLTSGATVHCGNREHHPDPRVRGDDITYSAAHHRVARAKGRASERRCARCPAQAEQWAYTHSDPDWRADADGKDKGKPYSLDPAHYEARCRSDHRRWDAAHKRIAGPHRPGMVSLWHHALYVAQHGVEVA